MNWDTGLGVKLSKVKYWVVKEWNGMEWNGMARWIRNGTE